MFARPVQPRSLAGGPLTGWLVLGAVWSLIVVFWLAWLAGHLAAALSGHQPTGPDFGAPFATDLLQGRWAKAWPHTNPLLVAVLFALLAVATFGGLFAAW